MKSMQIHFWGPISNTVGSVEKLIYAFAKYQTLFSPIIAHKGESDAVHIDENIKIYSFSESTIKNRILNKWLRLNAFTFDHLVPIIENERPEILHFHNRQDIIDSLIKRLSYRPKVVVHYHRHFETPTVPASANALIAVSEATRQYLLEKTATQLPIEVLHNPLSEQLLAFTPAPVKNRTPKIFFGGGSAKIKGFHELMQAVATLKSEFELYMSGGKLQDFMPPSSNIHNLGQIPHDEFLKEMSACDIVTMPSHSEPFGLVAQEALYLGKIVVATNAGGLAEFLSPDCAILVEPNNASSLAQGLEHAIRLVNEKSEAAAMMKERAQAKAMQFLPRIISGQLEEIYSRTLHSAQAGIR